MLAGRDHSYERVKESFIMINLEIHGEYIKKKIFTRQMVLVKRQLVLSYSSKKV